jgi:hypothetical protein
LTPLSRGQGFAFEAASAALSYAASTWPGRDKICVTSTQMPQRSSWFKMRAIGETEAVYMKASRSRSFAIPAVVATTRRGHFD